MTPIVQWDELKAICLAYGLRTDDLMPCLSFKNLTRMYWKIGSQNLCKIYGGWWLTYPTEKYEFVNWDDDIPNLWKKTCSKHVQTTNQYDITIFFIQKWLRVALHVQTNPRCTSTSSIDQRSRRIKTQPDFDLS